MRRDGAVELWTEHLEAVMPSHTSHGACAVELALHPCKRGSGYSFLSQRGHKTHKCANLPANKWPHLVSFAGSIGKIISIGQEQGASLTCVRHLLCVWELPGVSFTLLSQFSLRRFV